MTPAKMWRGCAILAALLALSPPVLAAQQDTTATINVRVIPGPPPIVNVAGPTIVMDVDSLAALIDAGSGHQITLAVEANAQTSFDVWFGRGQKVAWLALGVWAVWEFRQKDFSTTVSDDDVITNIVNVEDDDHHHHGHGHHK